MRLLKVISRIIALFFISSVGGVNSYAQTEEQVSQITIKAHWAGLGSTGDNTVVIRRVQGHLQTRRPNYSSVTYLNSSQFAQRCPNRRTQNNESWRHRTMATGSSVAANQPYPLEPDRLRPSDVAGMRRSLSEITIDGRMRAKSESLRGRLGLAERLRMSWQRGKRPFGH